MMVTENAVPIHKKRATPKTVPKKEKDNRKLPNGAKPDFGNGSTNAIKPAAPKAGKKKPSSKATLPNGEKPNFGNNVKEVVPIVAERLPSPSLPNGSKPNFGTEVATEQKKKKEQLLPDGSKVNFGAKQQSAESINIKKQPKKNLENLNNYAGGSFHSSPAAFNLPKPSLKKSTSPRPQSPSVPVVQPQQFIAPPQPPNIQMQAGFNPNIPPQYPVVGYNNGYHQPPPFPPYNNGYMGYNYYVPPNQMNMPPVIRTQPPPKGQNISFNDLLHSNQTSSENSNLESDLKKMLKLS